MSDRDYNYNEIEASPVKMPCGCTHYYTFNGAGEMTSEGINWCKEHFAEIWEKVPPATVEEDTSTPKGSPTT